MLKIRRVYVCDICDKVALPEYVIDGNGKMHRMRPSGWERIYEMDFCNVCASKYNFVNDRLKIYQAD